MYCGLTHVLIRAIVWRKKTRTGRSDQIYRERSQWLSCIINVYDDVTTMLIQQQVSDLLHGSKPLNNGQLELCGMGMLDRDTDTAENTAR